MIMHCITLWLQFGKQPDMTDINIENESNAEQVTHAVQDQSKIGWDQFLKGRISKHWGDIQQIHYDKERSAPSHNLKKYHDQVWWTANIIKQTVYIALNAW